MGAAAGAREPPEPEPRKTISDGVFRWLYDLVLRGHWSAVSGMILALVTALGYFIQRQYLAHFNVDFSHYVSLADLIVGVFEFAVDTYAGAIPRDGFAIVFRIIAEHAKTLTGYLTPLPPDPIATIRLAIWLSLAYILGVLPLGALALAAIPTWRNRGLWPPRTVREFALDALAEWYAAYGQLLSASLSAAHDMLGAIETLGPKIRAMLGAFPTKAGIDTLFLGALLLFTWAGFEGLGKKALAIQDGEPLRKLCAASPGPAEPIRTWTRACLPAGAVLPVDCLAPTRGLPDLLLPWWQPGSPHADTPRSSQVVEVVTREPSTEGRDAIVGTVLASTQRFIIVYDYEARSAVALPQGNVLGVNRLACGTPLTKRTKTDIETTAPSLAAVEAGLGRVAIAIERLPSGTSVVCHCPATACACPEPEPAPRPAEHDASVPWREPPHVAALRAAGRALQGMDASVAALRVLGRDTGVRLWELEWRIARELDGIERTLWRLERTVEDKEFTALSFSSPTPIAADPALDAVRYIRLIEKGSATNEPCSVVKLPDGQAMVFFRSDVFEEHVPDLSDSRTSVEWTAAVAGARQAAGGEDAVVFVVGFADDWSSSIYNLYLSRARAILLAQELGGLPPASLFWMGAGEWESREAKTQQAPQDPENPTLAMGTLATHKHELGSNYKAYDVDRRAEVWVCPAEAANYVLKGSTD